MRLAWVRVIALGEDLTNLEESEIVKIEAGIMINSAILHGRDLAGAQRGILLKEEFGLRARDHVK